MQNNAVFDNDKSFLLTGSNETKLRYLIYVINKQNLSEYQLFYIVTQNNQDYLNLFNG